ncbi:MAG TPA: TylF/MycF/NovP-related O-methyltransferase [Saprospiraceae bacterium]|nr:TylF/MycF/NovP-related O-methyltransferase [Saprospiraceae bacterium]HPN68256.1 TylF/MycF/NovP-related O-methyltransferase [Saprospiraceae bacterium]
MNLLFLNGLLKGFFFRLRGQYLVPAKFFNFLAHLSDLSRFINTHKTIEYCDFYTRKRDYDKRLQMFEYLITKYDLDAPLDYMEFGVSTGISFKWWVNKLKNPETRFYGFDTFSGLPEDWGPFKKGEMNNGNVAPTIEGDKRHSFYQGLFQQTLIPFLSNQKLSRRKVIHLDADLYSSTLYVLTLMTPYLQKGDILLFDEFNVPMHEYKAFKEWTEAFYIKYEVLASVNNFYQTAFMIL